MGLLGGISEAMHALVDHTGLPGVAPLVVPTEIQPYQSTPGAIAGTSSLIAWAEYWNADDSADLFGLPALDTLLAELGLTVNVANTIFTVTRDGLIAVSVVASGAGSTANDAYLALQSSSMNANPAVSIPAGAAADFNYNLNFVWLVTVGDTIQLRQGGTTADVPLSSVGMTLVRLSG